MNIIENCELKNGESIPTLESVLSYLSNKDLLKVIEFKDHPNFVSLNLIKKYLIDPSLNRIISFKKKSLDIVARYAASDPYFLEIPLFFLYRLFYFPKKDYHYSIHFTKKGLKRLLKHQGERELGVWTVDDKNDMKLVIENDIDYLTTNHPTRCLRLKESI